MIRSMNSKLHQLIHPMQAFIKECIENLNIKQHANANSSGSNNDNNNSNKQ